MKCAGVSEGKEAGIGGDVGAGVGAGAGAEVGAGVGAGMGVRGPGVGKGFAPTPGYGRERIFHNTRHVFDDAE